MNSTESGFHEINYMVLNLRRLDAIRKPQKTTRGGSDGWTIVVLRNNVTTPFHIHFPKPEHHSETEHKHFVMDEYTDLVNAFRIVA